MANAEFIQKRIEGKEKEIEKLNKKLERIFKAEATNWEKNPYWYSERDLVITQKDIKAAQVALDGYKAQLEVEIEKANSRNIPAILEFLAQWKARTMKHFRSTRKNVISGMHLIRHMLIGLIPKDIICERTIVKSIIG